MKFSAPDSRPHRVGLCFLVLVSGISLLLASACRPAPQAVPRYDDFLAHEANLELIPCADETWEALPLRSGQRIKMEVGELGANAVLTLAGCNGHGQRDAKEGMGQIRLRVVGASDSTEIHLEVPESPGWWTLDRKISLGDESTQGEPATLRLKANLPEGKILYLRDFHLRHEQPRSAQKPSERPRQILLISVDALRADALTTYGAASGSTPHLDRLATEAQVWDPHYAAATWTKPSHASMLTGYPPDVAPSTSAVLDPDVSTLAERLAAEGYRTGGLVHDCVWLNPKFGLHRGFQDYRSKLWRLPRQVRETVDWIGDHRDEPFFFFLHTFEVHSDFQHLPYEAPGIDAKLIEERFGVSDYGCRNGKCASGRLERIRNGEEQPLPREEEILRFLYAESVAFMDQQLGLLFDELRQAGVYDDLLIVFTADHGESFFEHGDLLHSFSWQEVLHVPLIVKWPKGRHAGERRDLPSSSLDIVPTILAELGLETSDLPGSPLLKRRRDRPIIAGTQEKVVIQENLKAIFQAGNNRLFDLAEDPGEEHNLATERPQDLGELGQLRNAFYRAYHLQRDRDRSTSASSETQALTEEEAERLRSLGYLGGN